jgi:hypothetical protein
MEPRKTTDLGEADLALLPVAKSRWAGAREFTRFADIGPTPLKNRLQIGIMIS